MRSFGRMASVIALAALILLVLPALVRDSNEQLPVDGGNASHEAVILCIGDTAIAETAAAPRDRISIRRNAVSIHVRTQLPVVSVICDGNGWPLTTQTWARTVYPACPPESEPGWQA